jgi:hypothetical protein
MRRWIRDIVAGLSAALLAATVVAWAWSYLEPVDFWSLPVSAVVATDVGLVACEGRVMVYCGRGKWPTPSFIGVYHDGEVLFDLDTYRRLADIVEVDRSVGAFAYWRSVEMGTRYHRVLAPMWFPLLAFAILPALWLRRHHARRQALRRLTGGACPACGYDLSGGAGRADLRSARCPECGRKPLEAYDAA